MSPSPFSTKTVIQAPFHAAVPAGGRWFPCSYGDAVGWQFIKDGEVDPSYFVLLDPDLYDTEATVAVVSGDNPEELGIRVIITPSGEQ